MKRNIQQLKLKQTYLNNALIMLFLWCGNVGCATAVDLVVQSVAGAIGGAVGNMADRRLEEKLKNDKENKNECEDCKDDKR